MPILNDSRQLAGPPVLHQVPLRPRDIVVSAASRDAAAGVEDILLRLVRRGRPGQTVVPEVDQAGPDLSAITQLLDAAPHRRVLATQRPLDSLPYRESLAYVAVIGDPRDDLAPLLEGETDPRAVRVAFDRWLATDPFRHVDGWWRHRRRPNVLVIHVADLANDPVTETATLAEHLGLALRQPQARAIAAEAQLSGKLRRASSWQGRLTDSDLRRYESALWDSLPADCVRYVKSGRSALW